MTTTIHESPVEPSQPSRDEWLRERCQYLGGSDMPALLGLHPYTTALQVWEAKTGKALPEAEASVNSPLRRGTRVEPYLAQTYEEMTGRVLLKSPTRRHATKSWCAVNPDYETIERDLLVELKSHNAFVADNYGPHGTDEVPAHEVIQTTWEMHIAGIDQCDLFVAFGWDDLRIYRIAYDPDLGAQLEQAADRFWLDHVLTGIAPAITGADPDTEWLKRRFPVDAGSVVRATPEIEAVILELAEAKRNYAVAEVEKARVENTIKAYMGAAAVLEWSGGKPITWKTAKSGKAVDWQAVAAALNPPADLVAAHTSVVPGSRRFIASFKGD